MKFRDWLEGQEYTRGTARGYLDGMHRLFVIGLSEGLVQNNPMTGVRLRTGTDKFIDELRRRPFEYHELQMLLQGLTDEPLEFDWMVRLLLYHGMRSGEVAQLRVGDLTTLMGVAVIRVHDRHEIGRAHV